MKIEKMARRIIILVVGICLWIIYLLESELSGYGIYTIISYRTHESMSVLPLIMLGITIIWMIFLIVKTVKRENDKEDIFFAVILLVLAVPQAYYLYKMDNRVTSSVVVTVENTDVTKQEMTVRNKEGQAIILETPELVCNMVQTDGTEYLVTYVFDHTDSWEGKLQMISYVE